MLVVYLLSAAAFADTLVFENEIAAYESLANTTVTLTGKSELHLTGAAGPLSGCQIHLNSDDAWLFLEKVRPSTASSSYLSQVRIRGAAAVLNSNVRVVEYGSGAVIIPHGPTYQPLWVYTEENFQGSSVRLNQYTAYNTSSLGTMANSIRSFYLKRGYTVTFAQNADGTGYSKNYVAQDSDLRIGVLPTKLDDRINFVRIFPWRWVSKKGSCDIDPAALNAAWNYNWNISSNSTLDWEYVAIRQQPYWPGLDQNWQTRGVNHLLGFNEPDNPVEDAYKNLNNGSRDAAIAHWPPLLETGLRVGAPAVTDGGQWWITEFMNKADAADLRVDFVPVHYYRGYWDAANPNGAAQQLYDFLKGIYDVVQRPLWVTEFNNGANWTSTPHPTVEQNRDTIEAMITMMDGVPWIERYAVYSRVEWFRQTHYDSGGITPMGAMYRDHESPIGYRQVAPGSGKSANAIYSYDINKLDTSGNGNHPLFYGSPNFAAGRYDRGLAFDGTDDYLMLPAHMGEATDFTFAAWVYWNGGGNWQRIMDFGADTNRYMFLTPSAYSQQLRFTITTSGYGGEQRLESGAFPVNTWTHVAVTLGGNTGCLYVNGAAVDTQTITHNPSSLGAMNNFLGKSQFANDPLFGGVLDEVLIADYALDAAAIAELVDDAQLERFVSVPLDIVGATAGSVEAGNPAINSYDRDRQTRWANDGTVANAWIRYDLGSVQEVERINLRLNVGSSRTYPLAIDIDGVQVFSGNTTTNSGYWETAVAPTSGRYVTVRMTGNNSSGHAWFSIWDAQIWGPANEPPAFDAEAFSKAGAIEDAAYSGSLADEADDPEGGALTFRKDAGPEWLTVAANGTLSGVPSDGNVGANLFTVRATDGAGLYATAEMTIEVANVYSGVRGLEDLDGLAAYWLAADCIDTPACGGADLDGDAAVTLDDFAAMAQRWINEEAL